MEKSQIISKLDELKTFKNELAQYADSVIRFLKGGLTEKESKRGSKIYNTISKKVGYLGSFISELSDMANVDVHGKKCNMWSIALKMPTDKLADSALGDCLLATNKAIGKLTDDINRGIRDKQGNIIGKPTKDAAESPVKIFNEMQLHPRVVEASKSCFVTGNYREAILNAFIRLIDYVKEITGFDLDGDDLMNKVFSFNYDKDLRRVTKYPIIRINELKNSNDRNEQQGFMFLCKGAAGGIRNPKAHKLIPQSNPLYTLEYLAFASLLMRRIEEGKVVKPSSQRNRWDWEKFLTNIISRCDPEIIEIAKNLYEFTRNNSDSISWGTGTQDGSFTFRKLGLAGMISIFSMYSYGWVYINFSSMKNKNVPDSIMESFKDNLNNIPNINIPKEVVSNGKYARIYEKPLTNYDNLKIFQDAVISLCQQLENSKEQTP